jgi:hypothetical protein
MGMPKQKPGRSRQDYETPQEFIDAINNDLLKPPPYYGPITMDLAATSDNAKAKMFVTPEIDSLFAPWYLTSYITDAILHTCVPFQQETAYLNPPFGRIEPWAKKCAETLPWLPENKYEYKGLILFLTPASIGSNWFESYVWPHARVYALKPRIKFVGEKHPYPKDCILSVYGTGIHERLDIWRWK